MKYRELMSDLRRGKILPLYLFSGEEELLIQEAVDLITEKAVDAGGRDFNFNTIYCRETPVADLVNLCLTLPFMSERRLVIAKEVDAYKTADLDQLAAYLSDPSPSTCLVILSHQRKFDKKAVVSAVEKRGAVSVFYPLLDREIIEWIDDWTKNRGISIERDAGQGLWQIIGNDLQKIRNELEKVLIFIGKRKKITFNDVKSVVGDFREYSPFDLADAIGRKKCEQALLILARLIQEGEQPVGILGSIAWNFRRLLRAKAMESAGAGYEDIKRKVGVIFHQSANFHEQMRRYSLDELRGVFSIMLAADRRLKSSGLAGRLVLERMILRLCGVEGGV